MLIDMAAALYNEKDMEAKMSARGDRHRYMEQLVEHSHAVAKRNDMHKDRFPDHKKHGFYAVNSIQ